MIDVISEILGLVVAGSTVRFIESSWAIVEIEPVLTTFLSLEADLDNTHQWHVQVSQ